MVCTLEEGLNKNLETFENKVLRPFTLFCLNGLGKHPTKAGVKDAFLFLFGYFHQYWYYLSLLSISICCHYTWFTLPCLNSVGKHLTQVKNWSQSLFCLFLRRQHKSAWLSKLRRIGAFLCFHFLYSINWFLLLSAVTLNMMLLYRITVSFYFIIFISCIFRSLHRSSWSRCATAQYD